VENEVDDYVDPHRLYEFGGETWTVEKEQYDEDLLLEEPEIPIRRGRDTQQHISPEYIQGLKDGFRESLEVLGKQFTQALKGINTFTSPTEHVIQMREEMQSPPRVWEDFSQEEMDLRDEPLRDEPEESIHYDEEGTEEEPPIVEQEPEDPSEEIPEDAVEIDDFDLLA